MSAVTVLALEGALASSVAITLDVLAMANRACEDTGRPHAFRVRVVGSGAPLFRPFLAFAEAGDDRAELFIIPAQGLLKAASYRDRLDEPDAKEAQLLIRAAAENGARVASSCTGTLLLANTGLLDGRCATTAWWLAPLFAEMFPTVHLDTAELVLTDGAFTTAGAAMAQMDLMVGLVASQVGTEIAETCARKMVHDERRLQSLYMEIGLLVASDKDIARATAWARPRLGERIEVADLARVSGHSPRTFARRVLGATGMSPVQLLQRLRVERAIELVESTQLPFAEIALSVGYADPSTLRTLIRRGAGLGPRDLRTRSRPGARPALIAPPEEGLPEADRLLAARSSSCATDANPSEPSISRKDTHDYLPRVKAPSDPPRRLGRP